MRGLTILEVAIATALLAVLFGSVAAAVSGDAQAHAVLAAQIGPGMRAQTALERITLELRMAGEWGEDVDQDGELGENEDTNGNGVLDSDWNLADPTTDQTTIAFNRRIDDIVDGETKASGIYSRRIEYRLIDDVIVRFSQRTDPKGNAVTTRTVIARRVADLRFSRTGSIVTVLVAIDVQKSATNTVRREFTSRIWLRN